jgi:hypothetical protein
VDEILIKNGTSTNVLELANLLTQLQRSIDKVVRAYPAVLDPTIHTSISAYTRWFAPGSPIEKNLISPILEQNNLRWNTSVQKHSVQKRI